MIAHLGSGINTGASVFLRGLTFVRQTCMLKMDGSQRSLETPQGRWCPPELGMQAEATPASRWAPAVFTTEYVVEPDGVGLPLPRSGNFPAPLTCSPPKPECPASGGFGPLNEHGGQSRRVVGLPLKMGRRRFESCRVSQPVAQRIERLTPSPTTCSSTLTTE